MEYTDPKSMSWSSKAAAAHEAFRLYAANEHAKPAYEAHERAHRWLQTYYVYCNGVQRISETTDERLKERLNDSMRRHLQTLKELNEEVDFFIRLETEKNRVRTKSAPTIAHAPTLAETPIVNIKQYMDGDTKVRSVDIYQEPKTLSRQERRAQQRGMKKSMKDVSSMLSVMTTEPAQDGHHSRDAAGQHVDHRIGEPAGDARVDQPQHAVGDSGGEASQHGIDMACDADMLAYPLCPDTDRFSQGWSKFWVEGDTARDTEPCGDAGVCDLELL